MPLQVSLSPPPLQPLGTWCNQVAFMQLMGLVDEDHAVSFNIQQAEDFPTQDEQLQLLQTAIDHNYYPKYRQLFALVAREILMLIDTMN